MPNNLPSIFTKSFKAPRIITYLASVAALVFLFATLFEIAGINSDNIPDPNRITSLILIDLILLLFLGILLLRKFLRIWQSFQDLKTGSRLQTRIITMFSLVAIFPTILVASFSIFFFNYGMQSWFNQRMDRLLEQSVNVANSYIKEHKLSVHNTAAYMVDNMSRQYHILDQDPALFGHVINTEAKMRDLDEALVFRKSTSSILAQTKMSFSLSFLQIPLHLLAQAERGEIVNIDSDPNKIRVLVKLHHDDYLLIGRLIDNKILDYIDKTNGAAENYIRLKNQSSSIQFKFSIAFMIVALLLLFSAIAFGIILSSQIVKPIISLVKATEKVKKGDLSVRVQETEHKDDEIGILSTAFNRMIQRISHQQRDLIIAQRSVAWAEVARRVAHEIKNPLTPIQLSVDRLMSKFKEKSHDPTAFAKYGNTILRHTDDIRKIVAEFVSFTKLPNPVFEECDLVQFLSELLESRSMIKEEYQYSFNSNIKSYNFTFDPNQINQVVVNLLKNAEEALEGVKNAKIKIDIVANLQYIIVEVSDNGKGFPAELIDKVSEPYMTTRTKGTGLGLSIVKKIINDHGGTIEFINLPSKGAMVKLIFELDQLRKKAEQ